MIAPACSLVNRRLRLLRPLLQVCCHAAGTSSPCLRVRRARNGAPDSLSNAIKTMYSRYSNPRKSVRKSKADTIARMAAAAITAG